MDNTAKMTFLTLLFKYRSAVHQIIAVYTNIKYREITKLIPGKRFRDSTGIEDWTRPTIPNEQNSYTRGRRHTAVELELSTKKNEKKKKERKKTRRTCFFLEHIHFHTRLERPLNNQHRRRTLIACFSYYSLSHFTMKKA